MKSHFGVLACDRRVAAFWAILLTVLCCVATLVGCGGDKLSPHQKMNQIAVWEDQGWTANGRLYTYLFDDDEDVRVRTALALGRVNDSLALDTLRHALLEDASPRVRAMAAFAMGAWQWRVAKEPLLEAIPQEENPEVLVAILQSLARNYAREEHAQYVHLLRHPDPRVRIQTALTLDIVNWRDDADSIIVLLDDPDLDVRWAALFALGRMKSEAAARRALSLCSDPDPRMRKMAYRLAASFPTAEAGDTLIKGLEDPDPEVRSSVADAFLALRDTLVIMRALPFLRSDPDPRCVQRLARSVGQLWREDASGTLMQLLDHPDPAVRAEATKSLCNRRDLLCANLIAPAASDPDPRVRVAFLESVDQVQRYGGTDTTVIFPLVRRLLNDTVPLVRARAVQSYSAFGQPDWGEVLNRLFHDTDPHVVSMAVNLIGSQHIMEYTDSLHSLYQRFRNNPRPEVKWSIMAAGANLLPSIHIDSTRQDLLDWGMADPNRLVRWYTIAVADKFRQDLRSGLGVYQTDLTPDNIDELLHPYVTPPRLRLNTTQGPVTIELDTEWAPRTARHMIAAVRDGIYDDMPINEANAGQAIQTGDRRGDGLALPDETVRDEYSPLRIDKGSVFWLLQTRDGGRGTFGIALDRQPYLDGRQP
ncbi:MAG TPA: HEAT repeat domain-containing protein, partial [Acidobacteriota bacterium]|nr:HEAT repeat domain-containing protein [Acidobacteriota bacterium]